MQQAGLTDSLPGWAGSGQNGTTEANGVRQWVLQAGPTTGSVCLPELVSRRADSLASLATR